MRAKLLVATAFPLLLLAQTADYKLGPYAQRQPNVPNGKTEKFTFDKSKISYADLLEKWFFMLHDPTTANRQGNDAGTQYRSAIFYTTDEQKKIADEVIARVNASGQWPRKVVTEVAKAGKFTSAEDYHQDYLVKHPGGYTCHFMREPKAAKQVK